MGVCDCVADRCGLLLLPSITVDHERVLLAQEKISLKYGLYRMHIAFTPS